MHYILFYDVVDDYASRRAQFREAHLKLARQAYERGELVLAGAPPHPVDGAGLGFPGPPPPAAGGFAPAGPPLTNQLVPPCRRREGAHGGGGGGDPPRPPGRPRSGLVDSARLTAP